MITTEYRFTMFTGEEVTVRIEIPIDECRLRRKIEKDYKRRGSWGGNPDFDYPLSKEEHIAIKESFLNRDLFSKHKIKM